MIRYRTETFSGLGERNIIDVMRYETFELGNTDILETLQNGILKDHPICENFNSIISFLQGDGNKDFDLSINEQEHFFKDVVDSINDITGLNLKYCLWLADRDALIDNELYGQYIENENDIDTYEIGPVILSELGYDGTLYAYTDYPVSLEEQLKNLLNEKAAITNNKRNNGPNLKQVNCLDERYQELEANIKRIERIFADKEKLLQNEKDSNQNKDTLFSQIQSAKTTQTNNNKENTNNTLLQAIEKSFSYNH